MYHKPVPVSIPGRFRIRKEKREGVTKSIFREKEDLPHQYIEVLKAARYSKNPRDFSISGGLLQ
jgi:hypothetical protein